jgi:hypothetical protein
VSCSQCQHHGLHCVTERGKWECVRCSSTEESCVYVVENAQDRSSFEPPLHMNDIVPLSLPGVFWLLTTTGNQTRLAELREQKTVLQDMANSSRRAAEQFADVCRAFGELHPDHPSPGATSDVPYNMFDGEAVVLSSSSSVITPSPLRLSSTPSHSRAQSVTLQPPQLHP